jgi:FkbM family methyltransferase
MKAVSKTFSRIRHPAAALRRIAAVQDAARFAANQIRRADGMRSYRLREMPWEVTVRHGTADIAILEEVFVDGEYASPLALRSFLSSTSGLRVLDLGGNIGTYAVWTLGTFADADVTSYEPDPENAAVLRAAFVANSCPARWHIFEAAVGVGDGSVDFMSGLGPASRSSTGTEPGHEAVANLIRVPVVDVFPLLERCDLAKFDIEGAEWAILSDPRLRTSGVKCIVMESHLAGAPQQGDPGTLAAEMLREAGFEVTVPKRKGAEMAVLWAWRPEYVPTFTLD